MVSDNVIPAGYAATSVLCETGEFAICRALSRDLGQVLLKVPASSRPPASAILQLEHEYETARELDPAFAVRPLRIERSAGHIALLLEDFTCHALSDDVKAPMDLGQFFKIAVGATAALAAIHWRGVVHKDVKPENIFLDGGGPDGAIQVKLTGFGVALRLSRERQAPSPPEVIAGTLAYMAPEQTGRMNRSIDSRSDLYALGVTFYQMLTGRLPFTASDPMEWVHCHIALEPPPLSRHRAALPEPLSDIVMKLLAKTAEDRYQTAGGLKADLERCAAEWREHGRIDAISTRSARRPRPPADSREALRARTGNRNPARRLSPGDGQRRSRARPGFRLFGHRQDLSGPRAAEGPASHPAASLRPASSTNTSATFPTPP